MFENDKETQSLDKFTQQLFEKLITATKISNSLPSDDEYQYYASFKPFKSEMEDFGKRLYHLTQNFLQHERPEALLSDDMDDVGDKFEEVVDFVDRLMEKVDLYTEDRSEKPKTNIVIAKVSKSNPTRQGGRSFDSYMVHGTNIPRPQDKFEETIDNSDSPFVPKIKNKVNALKPLDPIIIHGQAVRESGVAKQHTEPSSYPHPYESELRSLQFPEEQLHTCSEKLYRPLDETPYTWVSELEQLQELATKLELVKEFAIDLEHHAYRSYQGFVCLMQISTRSEDFIVDTLALRNHINILNTSFTDPNIVKVLHGSDSDVVWLQSDFGVYIVNMFDTGQASRVLDFPSFSLAYLLKFYCNVDADKKYQLADWRIRELPAELVKYAREDTHYLLYIYDRLRNELVARSNENSNLIISVWNRSKELCLKRYEKERLTENSHIMLYQKSNLLFNPIQMRVFASVYKWRDTTARQEDESTRYVLPNNMLFTISEMMPTDVPSLIACCNPVPPYIRVYAHEVVRIIAEEKEFGAKVQPVSQQILQPPPQQQQQQQQPTPVTRNANLQHLYFRDAHDPRSLFHSTTFTPINSTPSIPPISIPSRDTDHKDAPSPVLTTEQLYHTAGWLDSEPGNTAPAPTTRRKATATVKTAASLFPDEVEDDSSGEEDSIAKQTAALIRSNLANQSPFPSFSLRMLPMNAPPGDTSSSSEDVIKETEGDQEDSEEDNEPGDAVTKNIEPPQATKTPASKNVPRSMAEIYKLSNQNRKRNKEKKKLKEDVATHPSSPVVLLEDSDGDADRELAATRSKRQKGSHKRDVPVPNTINESEVHPVDDDTVEFMKEIGWIPNPDKNSSGGGDVKSSTPQSKLAVPSVPVSIPNNLPSSEYGLSSPPKSKQSKKRQPSPRGQPPSARAPSSHTLLPPFPQPQHFKPPNFVPFDYNNTTFSATPTQINQQTPQAYYNPYASSGTRGARTTHGTSRPKPTQQRGPQRSWK